MLNYCTLPDLLYKDALQDTKFIGVTIGDPIRDHKITGWVSLCGVFLNKQEKKLFDIWLGFNFEKFDLLCDSLKLFSETTNVRIM